MPTLASVAVEYLFTAGADFVRHTQEAVGNTSTV